MDDELFDGIAALAATSGLQESSDGPNCLMNHQFTDIEEAVATSLLPKEDAQNSLKRYKDDSLVSGANPVPASGANGIVCRSGKPIWTDRESCLQSEEPHPSSDDRVSGWLGSESAVPRVEEPLFRGKEDGDENPTCGSSDSKMSADGNEKGQGKPKGRVKRKKEGKDSGHQKDENKKRKRKKNRVQNHLRKNIRDILTDDKLESETLAAQQAEMERKRRLLEIQQRAQQMMAQQMLLKQEQHLAVSDLLRKDGYHPMMGSSLRLTNHMSLIPEPRVNSYVDPNEEVILVESSSSESGTENESRGVTNCVVISSSDDESSSMEEGDEEGDSDEDGLEDDDDEVAVLSGSSDCEDSKEAEDVQSSGSHVNDNFNVPDAQGRVLVNVGHPAEDPDIFLAPHLARIVKPHQIGGIRFMYDNTVESLNSYKTNSGFGCILAHSMGLGKTLQVISFVDVFLRHTEGHSVLIIVPINTIQNWVAEFNNWIPPPPDAWSPPVSESGHEQKPLEQNGNTGDYSDSGIRYRHFDIVVLGDAHKTNPARAKAIRQWMSKGGVLLMGYEMYRIILNKNGGNGKIKKGGRKSSLKFQKQEAYAGDGEEYEKNKELILEMQQNLLKPDLVICDEGHRIKNCHASTSQALKNIKTRRRVVLTGYPLQNNLSEYWCMVDFVRPNFLGTRVEFCNMFERPIQNGQCMDSTPEDIRLMRFRAHVLHSLLEGFVQRRGHSVLRMCLPQKFEHVLLVRMTAAQRLLYRTFMQELQSRNAVTNPIRAFSVCCKIWNHPDVLYQCLKDLQLKGLEDDLDLEETKLGTSLGTSTSKPRKKGAHPKNSMGNLGHASGRRTNVGIRMPPSGSVMGVGDNGSSLVEPEIGFMPFREKPETNILSYEWAHSCLKDYRPGVIDNGLKMVLAFCIIEQSLLQGDRLLLFSQSLFTLNLIEEFLGKLMVPFSNGVKWTKNTNYFRLDGGTTSMDREKLVNEFNSNPNIFLFLISTRAGSLGINLVGANRVIVLDASWNPCHDTQAVCRIYRYGQTKPCHVYRMVADNTLEKKIYDRQINKQGMSDRVVDELSPDVTLTMKEVSNLLCIDEEDPPEKELGDIAGNYEDQVLRYVCRHLGRCLARQPFEHESQLMDRKELKLTKTEKRMAKQSYEMDKKASVHFGRNASYYSGGYSGISRGDPFSNMDLKGTAGRPVVNVRPTQSTAPRPSPLDILAKQGVTFRQIHLTKEVQIPPPDGQGEPIVIPPGQQVMIISSPRGIFLRCPNNKLVQISHPSDGTGRQSVKSGLTTPNRFQSDSANNSLGPHEAEVIDLSDDDDDEEDDDDDDDIIVTSSTPTTYPASRSVIVSPGSNTYTSQNPALLTGGMVMRNDTPIATQTSRPPQHCQQTSLLLPHPVSPVVSSVATSSTTSSRPTTSTYVHPMMLGLGARTNLETPVSGGATGYCDSGSVAMTSMLGTASNGDPRVTVTASNVSMDGQSAPSHPPLSSSTMTPTSKPMSTIRGGTANSELPTSAMDYLNKALSTPSYSAYPSWGSGGWSGGSYVQGQSQAADQVAFMSSIRDLLLPSAPRLFPASTSLPELVTAPLSARHLGALYPHVLDVANDSPSTLEGGVAGPHVPDRYGTN